MYTIIYGSRTFILETEGALQLMKQACSYREAGDDARAREFVSLAVKVENGTIAADSALVASEALKEAA